MEQQEKECIWLAPPLTECQDDPMHDLSLALNDQVQVAGIGSSVNTKKVKAEVTPYDLANIDGTLVWRLPREHFLRQPRGD